ncbi:hypothetical protein D3C81_680260 [compost metagenome]
MVMVEMVCTANSITATVNCGRPERVPASSSGSARAMASMPKSWMLGSRPNR